MKLKYLKQGDILFEQGQPSNRLLYILLDGEACVLQDNAKAMKKLPEHELNYSEH